MDFKSPISLESKTMEMHLFNGRSLGHGHLTTEKYTIDMHYQKH
jgi:hypothetical protein